MILKKSRNYEHRNERENDADSEQKPESLRHAVGEEESSVETGEVDD
jgi:hypothetical protein